MRIPNPLRPALVLGAVTALSACGVPTGPLNARDTVVETRSLDPNGSFSLENVNGRVEIEAWSKPEVRIEAERAAVNERALERLRVEVEGEGSSVEVKTRHERHGGLLSFLHGGGKVDYHVTLPAGARVRLSTVNGPVEVQGVTGELRVKTVNGGVTIRDAAGEVQAETVNGAIDARYEAAPASGRQRFQTVNGGIEVSLPEGATGRLEAKTVNGSVGCDLPLSDTEKSRRRLSGRLGPGDGDFHMETVNGSIHVRRGTGHPPAEASLR
jgi:DUF4097 and DUF4098 domain-containing protein YvlB